MGAGWTDLVGRIAGVDAEDGDGAIALDDPGAKGKALGWMEKRRTDHFSTAYIW